MLSKNVITSRLASNDVFAASSLSVTPLIISFVLHMVALGGWIFFSGIDKPLKQLPYGRSESQFATPMNIQIYTSPQSSPHSVVDKPSSSEDAVVQQSRSNSDAVVAHRRNDSAVKKNDTRADPNEIRSSDTLQSSQEKAKQDVNVALAESPSMAIKTDVEATVVTAQGDTVEGMSLSSSDNIEIKRRQDILRQQYYAELLNWFDQRKRYPGLAKKRRMQGRVLVKFAINPVGEVRDVALLASSGHRLLDKTALSLVSSASGLPMPPSELRQGRLQLALPIDYALR